MNLNEHDNKHSEPSSQESSDNKADDKSRSRRPMTSRVDEIIHSLKTQRTLLMNEIQCQSMSTQHQSKELNDSVIHHLLQVHKQRRQRSNAASSAFYHYETSVHNAAKQYKIMKSQLATLFLMNYRLSATDYSHNLLQQLSTAVAENRKAAHCSQLPLPTATATITSNNTAQDNGASVTSNSTHPECTIVSTEMLKNVLSIPQHIRRAIKLQQRRKKTKRLIDGRRFQDGKSVRLLNRRTPEDVITLRDSEDSSALSTSISSGASSCNSSSAEDDSDELPRRRRDNYPTPHYLPH